MAEISSTLVVSLDFFGLRGIVVTFDYIICGILLIRSRPDNSSGSLVCEKIPALPSSYKQTKFPVQRKEGERKRGESKEEEKKEGQIIEKKTYILLQECHKLYSHKLNLKANSITGRFQ